jgi:hypothetical protein
MTFRDHPEQKAEKDRDRALLELGRKAIELADLKASLDARVETSLELEAQRDRLEKKVQDFLRWFNAWALKMPNKAVAEFQQIVVPK